LQVLGFSEPGLLRNKKGSGIVKQHHLLFLSVVSVFSAVISPVWAVNVIYVDDDAPLGGDGLSWDTAYRFLQDGIADAKGLAPEPVEIRVAQGVYKPDRREANPEGTRDQEISFYLTDGQTLKGGYAGLGAINPNARDIAGFETILSGDLAGNDEPIEDPTSLTPMTVHDFVKAARSDNSACVLGMGGQDAMCVVDGLIITGAVSFSEGSGLLVGWASIMVRDCRFVGNIGGGIRSTYANSLTVLHCTFARNWTWSRGGGIHHTGGMFRLEECTFLENVACAQLCIDAGYGGAFYSDSFVAGSIIKNCMFLGNIAGSGGAVALGSHGHGPFLSGRSGQAQVVGCKFSGNRAAWGGAMSINLSTLDVADCEFRDNTAAISIGALSIDSSEVNLRNSLFYGNRASRGVGCILAHGMSGVGGRGGRSTEPSELVLLPFNLTLDNCTLVGNSGPAWGAITCISRGTASVDTLCVSNCILDNHGQEIDNQDGSQIQVAFTNLRGGIDAINDPCNVLGWGQDNMDVDPLFVNPGYWDPNGTPEDVNDDFFGAGDYHLQSQAGRWDANSGAWVQDDVTSPCIDAGDPNSPIMFEPFPNSGVINMGAYGGTVEASKSYLGEPVCETIVAGDINGDCKVDFEDLMILMQHWTEF